MTGRLARTSAPGSRVQGWRSPWFALGQLVAGGALQATATEELLLDAAARTGQAEMAALRTIRSGFRAGANRPRKVPA